MTKKKTETKPKTEKKNYFTERELKCKHTGDYVFDEGFLEILNAIREECEFALPISSGYRSPNHPLESRKTATGAHCTGKAVDVAVGGLKALKLIEVAQKHGIKRIGVNQRGSGRFIHLDICTAEDFPDRKSFPETAIWSY